MSIGVENQLSADIKAINYVYERGIISCFRFAVFVILRRMLQIPFVEIFKTAAI